MEKVGPAMSQVPQIFDRALLKSRRDRAALTDELPDFLLSRVAEDLKERLGIVRRDFPRVLDLGAHHGVLGRALGGLQQIGTIVQLDSSARLLARAEGETVIADEEMLPFEDASFDLVVSGLALQTVNDLPGVLLQARRVLKPDGLLLASLLGGATLSELRHAWLAAEDEVLGGASPRVAPFADVRDMGGLLQRAGFALPVVDADVVTVTYGSALALMAELRAMGASNVLSDRSRVPVTRGLLGRAAEIYQGRFGLATGRVPATFEILTLTAWVPHESQQKPLRPGSAQSRLADALGTVERKV